MTNETVKCPVCGTGNTEERCHMAENLNCFYNCPRCGEYALRRLITITTLPSLSQKQKAVLSYHIRKNQKDGNLVYLGNGDYPENLKQTLPFWLNGGCPENIKQSLINIDEIKTDPLPKVGEQVNKLIKLIGKKTDGLGGELWTASKNELSAILGCVLNENGLINILESVKEQGFTTYSYTPLSLKLTFKGWERYEELRVTNKGNKAFMAMTFTNDLGEECNIGKMLKEHFAPAIKIAFEIDLQMLTDKEKAGNIDARLIAEIRASRFMVADTTHCNNGVYWEAGFAEGLNKPVIYTCQKDAFENKDKDKRPHFDIAHYNTIQWDLNNPDDAVERLVNIIRNTFQDLPFDEKWKEKITK